MLWILFGKGSDPLVTGSKDGGAEVKAHPVIVVVGKARVAAPHLEQEHCKAVHVSRLGHLAALKHFRRNIWQ